MTEDVRLPTGDGGEVVGDLWVVPDAWAGAVVCHPHPAYGGDRHNAVVDRLFHTLAGGGVTALRFDFRRGEGDEQADVVAGVDRVAEALGGGAADRPLWLVGYSFGADIALSVGDDRVAGWVAVAPPLQFGPPAWPGEGDERPVLVVAAAHDRFSPPEHLQDVAAAWPDATITVVPGADHFLAGAAQRVADTALTWLRDRL